MRSDALYASQACKMRHRRATGREPAQRATSRNKAVTRTRHPTRYSLIPADQLEPVATVEAHDRAAAARQVDVDVVPIPERSLRPV